jgi:hypothetical protein
VTAGAQLDHEARAGDRLGEAEAVVLELPEALEELVAAGAGGETDAGPPGRLRAGLLGVRRVARDRDLVTRAEDVLLAVQLHPHRAFEHRVVLGDADMDVPDGDEALRAADDVDFGVLAAGRFARRAELHPHS